MTTVILPSDREFAFGYDEGMERLAELLRASAEVA